MMFPLQAKTIPHKDHRYPTVGDYWTDEKGVEQFRVSKMSNPDYEFLVLIHELVEDYLCQRRGISEPKQIKPFDEWFEKARELGMVYDDDEPGCHPNAPYMREHMFAMMIERLVGRELGVDWNKYAEEVESL
jgi:hypothetical protein